MSALEKWLKKREPDFAPSWQFRSRQTYSVMFHSCGVGDPPAIDQLSPVLDRVVDKLSDEQIAALVTVLRHGSREEQSQMIDKITDQLFAEAAPANTK